ncbi:MAG: preprotein translocase subunit SecG [Phycisphaerales bacterium]
MILTLAQIPVWLTAVLIAVFLFVCVLLILTVLIQRPAGGGLAGAFGSGAGSGQTAFGAKTGDALTFATILMFVVYVLFAVGLNYAARPPKAVDEQPEVTGTDGTGAMPAATGPTGSTAPTASTGSTTAPEQIPSSTPPTAATGTPAATPPPAPIGPSTPPQGAPK